MLATWQLEHNYCFSCRAVHREMSKGKNRPDLPLCDLTAGGKCEKVPSWKDENDEIHTEPFYLYPENLLAMEIYERTIQLSSRQTIQWMNGKKRMEANISTLEKLDFILKYFLPEEYVMQQTIDLIDSVVMVYNLKLKYSMSG